MMLAHTHRQWQRTEDESRQSRRSLLLSWAEAVRGSMTSLPSWGTCTPWTWGHWAGIFCWAGGRNAHPNSSKRTTCAWSPDQRCCGCEEGVPGHATGELCHHGIQEHQQPQLFMPPPRRQLPHPHDLYADKTAG